MTVHNADVARVFDRLADLLKIDGANLFRVRAYRDAARIVADLPQEVSALVAAGKDLSELHGIGKDLAGKVPTLAPPLKTMAKKTSPKIAKGSPCELSGHSIVATFS